MVIATTFIVGTANAATHRYVVVIDPGHGGRDPGAISPSGSGTEKSITLAISLEIRDQLKGQRDLKVVLTRSSDQYVTLAERQHVAEANHADLFLSIHADSSSNSLVGGASIYTLREDGRAVVVKRIAATNNADGIGRLMLDPDVALVLSDLQQRAAMNDSAGFALKLSTALTSVISMRSQPRLSAHFAVLKARGVPAVLLETGYITEASDARVLFSSSGQKRIAEAIANTIKDYRIYKNYDKFQKPQQIKKSFSSITGSTIVVNQATPARGHLWDVDIAVLARNIKPAS